MRTLLAKGLFLIWVGIGFLPLSFFLNQELRTSVGGTPTGEVFVNRRTGEVTGPANFIGEQFTRSARVRFYSLLLVIAGVVMSAMALIARRTRSVNVGTDESVWKIFKAVLGRGFGALFIGAIVGFLIFAPLKTLPDRIFDFVLVLLFVVSVMIVLVKKRDISSVID
jgi:hypothetical protein